MLRLLLSKGADPSIRNLENDQPAHLLQSGPRGDQVSRQNQDVGQSRYQPSCTLISGTEVK